MHTRWGPGFVFNWKQLAVCAVGLGLLGGCARTTTAINPDQLPALAKSVARYPDGWHDMVAADGSRVTVKARITSVVVKREAAGASQEDTFTAPFRATVEHGGWLRGGLRLADHSHEHVYALGEIDAVTVHHADEGHRVAIGIVLIAASTVPLGFAGYGFYNAPHWGREAGLLAPLVFGASAAGGLGLAIPGIVLIATQKEDPRKAHREAVSVDLGPAAARLRFAF